ncbi:MAG: TolC family protein [Bacteroidota bacterium]
MTKLYKTLFIVLVLSGGLVFGNSVHAQENTRNLSLEACIDLARNQSPIARSARNALEASRWAYRTYRADLLPSLNLQGNAPGYNKSINPITQEDGSIVYRSQQQSDVSSTVSINQTILPTGGELSLSSGISRLEFFGTQNDYYLWQSTPLVVGFSQPLFQYNDLKWRYRIEPIRYQQAKKEYVEQMESMALQVTQRFFDAYLARINLENAKFNVQVNDSIYTVSQGRYTVGKIAENDLLQSELALRNAESSLSNAELEYEQAIENLKITLGIPPADSLTLDIPSELPDADVDVQKALELARENNSTFMDYQIQRLTAERELDRAKKQSGFSAEIRVNYGLNQSSSQFDELYSDLQNRQFATVGFNIPIFNWGKQRAAIKSARNQKEETANQISLEQQRFNQQIEYRVKQFLQLSTQVQLAAKADTIAQRRYEVTRNRYLIGKVDITNLLIAQNEKDSARQSYIRSLREFWTGWYDLRRLTLYDFADQQEITYPELSQL